MKKKSRKRLKEKQRQMVTVAVVIALIGIIIASLFVTGVFQILADDTLIFSTIDATVDGEVYQLEKGNCFAQAFVVPDDVTKISTIGIAGFEGNGVGVGYLGFSLTKTANVNLWARIRALGAFPMRKGGVIGLDVYVPVYPGQVVYLMFYWDFPTAYKYSSTTNLYPSGEFHYYKNGVWSVKSAQDARFRVRGYLKEVVNSPPTNPLVTGDVSLTVNQKGNWMAVSTDVDGDTLRYVWTVDGVTMRTSGYVASGTSDSFSHSFSSSGTKTIAVKAEDSKGASSGGTQRTVEVTQALPGTYAVTITVVDATTYALLREAAVQIGSEVRYTDTQGTASFSLPTGTYTASVSKAEYESKTEAVTVGTAPVSKTVSLMPVSAGPPQPGALQVVIEVFDDTTYMPLKDVYVTMGDETGTTDGNGQVVFFVDAGTYTVVASKSEYEVQMATTTVTSDKYLSLYLEKSVEPVVPEPEKIPGFELGVMLAAFGIALLLYARKRRQV